MSKEHPQPEEVYGFMEWETLYDRVTDARFRALIEDERTTIHKVEVAANSYGEFLFVSTSRAAGESRVCVSFFGLGYHDHRERWFTQEWFWYRANTFSEVLEKTVSKDEVGELLRQRREEIAPYASQQAQSGRGKLFEMLAELTDDDDAITELEDLGDLADLLGDELE